MFESFYKYLTKTLLKEIYLTLKFNRRFDLTRIELRGKIDFRVKGEVHIYVPGGKP